MRLLIAYALATLLTLTACNNSGEEDLTTITASPSPVGSGAVIFCPQIGGAIVTPTSPPSCQPPASVGDLSGVSLEEADPPPLPSNLLAASTYYIVEGGAAGLPAQINIDLLNDSSPGALAWYTHDGDDWQRLDTPVQPIGPAGHPVAIGDFDELPPNLIVLAEPE